MDGSLVGRDRELAALTGWLDAPFGGRVVLIGGQAGIGKTRLVTAVAERAASTGQRVLWGRTTEHDGAPPYWPWRSVLQPLGFGGALEDSEGADPEAERFGRFEAISAALVGLDDAPVLVVLEDMHRADHASLRLLAHLADRVPAAPARLVVTFRPNPADQSAGFAATLDGLLRQPSTERLDLTGLGFDGVAELLGGSTAPETVHAVYETSGGNPLYVGELARHLRAGGSLAAVPTSIRDSVRLRLDARSPGCVEVVRIGAVAGRTFEAGRVATVSGRPALGCLADLDEAVAAGLVEPTGKAGEFRFTHALVRDAVEATLTAAELPMMHRAVADAIETYDGTGDEQAAELARHWDAASAAGDRPTAATWCERAATIADRRLAWEEAARLFDRALDLGGTADALAEHRRAIGSARARLHCDEIAAAIAMCVVAAGAATRAGRPDLAAEAALVPEGRALESLPLREATLAALEALKADDHARRARLHGHLTHMSYYLDPTSMIDHCEQCEAEAALAGDPLADLAAIRARHTVSYGPEHAALRLDLADRLGRVARSIRRPSVAIWDPLWRIDALVELGRLQEAVAVVPTLASAVAALGMPIFRWHLARVEAALAQATGRFGVALQHAEDARRLFAVLEVPVAAEAMYLGFRTPLAMHAGWTVELAERWASVDMSTAPPFLGDLPYLGPASALAGIGDLARASQWYDRCLPAEGWDPPPSLWLHLHAVRIQVASMIGRRDDIVHLRSALEPHRGLHVGTGGGVITYLGPVELWLGVGAAAVADWDAADRDLATAAQRARDAGAPGFVVHAEVERAEALVARSGHGDQAAARELLAETRPVAERLGMRGFVDRIDAASGTSGDGLLSRRELEVAALVADGRTNKEIAATLYLSERTAQNHVQHILTKLGVANRTQIAAWYRQRV